MLTSVVNNNITFNMMDEQNIPIDINTNKLLDWLISRRHVNKDWQDNVLKIRGKINNAIQDMPAHEGIIKLLSGQHVNYFHCLKIVDILKETEADSKNIFGQYGSQRMKDWQDIVNLYQKDNLYLAEAAQMLIRNVNYEIPSLRKQIAKLNSGQGECEKKIKDYTKTELLAHKEFDAICQQLGITGRNIKTELLELLKDLPDIYQKITEKIKIIQPAMELYTEFNKYLLGKEEVALLTALKYLIENGNTTTYEYTYGQKPVQVEEFTPVTLEARTSESEDVESNEIDYDEIDFEINTDNSIDFGDIVVNEEQNIDWGNQESSDEGFEMVSHEDLNYNLEESGIVVEKTGIDGGIAKGEEALTILDNPKIASQIMNNLIEISAFLKMRMYEMANDTDLLAMTQMQDAPTLLQMQTIESITSLNDCVNVVLDQLMNRKLLHLQNIKHSPKYVDILTETLKQKLSVVERMKANKKILEEKIKGMRDEARAIEPVIKVLIDKTKELQKEIESDISKKYKGRPVHLVGGISML
ncbi:unnamed protein product [Acanthoscelides obtectus]|uniref:CDK5 regulatory subunit-associated protein 3 n=1 Tax=Acanthoscelides obtectus TaxID=200917 RepID=A0A9P0K6G9_ACAOB|nr:unnamed protein product [Acanthoscelides obtectus]CAK1622804.1 CDK5 regulatory subunit-associated protein 3 [Acanthoscelides obtectus]